MNAQQWVQIRVRLRPDDATRLRVAAALGGVSAGELFRQVLEQWLDTHQGGDRTTRGGAG